MHPFRETLACAFNPPTLHYIMVAQILKLLGLVGVDAAATHAHMRLEHNA